MRVAIRPIPQWQMPAAQRMAHTMFDQGLLQRPVSVASLIDDRFVRGSKP